MEHQTLGWRVICPSEPAYYIVDCWISSYGTAAALLRSRAHVMISMFFSCKSSKMEETLGFQVMSLFLVNNTICYWQLVLNLIALLCWFSFLSRQIFEKFGTQQKDTKWKGKLRIFSFFCESFSMPRQTRIKTIYQPSFLKDVDQLWRT